MKKFFICFAVLLSAITVLCAADSYPEFAEIKKALRKQHPRLFITGDQLPAFRARANGVCKEYLLEMQKRVDALPDQPVFEIKNPAAHFDGKKVTFSKMLNDQNATEYAFKNFGGYESAACAILYHATGERKYLEKGYRYMMHLIDFCRIARNSGILPEWYHYGRLCGLFAYDMFYNDLTPEQRKSFIVPLLDYLQYMRKPPHSKNSGDYNTGNYGEKGLWWFAGLAASGDGYADEMAEKFLADGWQANCRMMDYRDQLSGGKGLLTSICTGYSFGAYPWATNHFLLSLKNACGIDGTRFWVQPRDYAHYFSWMMIRSPLVRDGFGDYGWGDAFHVGNNLTCSLMYTHLAYTIHFYGDDPRIRALMSILPPRYQKIMNRTNIPWTVFVLTGFDPSKKFTGDANSVLSRKTAEFFPSFGLLNMRSGLDENATYASIKAGAAEDGHQHYDELAFVIFRQGYQAMDTGNRGIAPHHLVYYAQTIAHNSLLIRMEKEPLAPHWYPANAEKIDRKTVFNDGGQNRRKAGRNLGVDIGELHAATVADATQCYSGEKCKEAIRHFIYIKPDYFIVYDRLTSVRPEQEKVFLLHSRKQPEKVKGVWKSRGGNGALFIKTVLPADAKTEIIGGPGKEFQVQGRNYPVPENVAAMIARAGGLEKTWLGCWRMEITPGKPAGQTRFLNVMQTADGNAPEMIPVQDVSDEEFDAVRFTTRDGITVTARFRRAGKVQGFLKLEKDGKVLLDKALNKPADIMPPQTVVRRTVPEVLPPGMARQARIDAYLSGKDVVLKMADSGSARPVGSQRWMEKPGRSGTVMVYPLVNKDWQTHSATLHATGDGTVLLKVMGPDVRKDGQFQKVRVDYKKITVNGKVLYEAKDKPLTVWHGNAHSIQFPVKNGEFLKFEVICRPTAIQ